MSGGLERLHVADDEWPAQALECEWSDLLDVGHLGDCSGNSGSNQNLTVLGGFAQARGGIDHSADRAVIEAPLEADLAERSKALRNTDAETDLIVVPAPSLRQYGHGIPHRDRKADSALG